MANKTKKTNRAPIVRTPDDVTSRQESKPAWLSHNLAMILQPVFVYYYCLCLKSYTFIIFLLGLDMFVFCLLVGRLAFPAIRLFIRCFRSCDLCSVVVT